MDASLCRPAPVTMAATMRDADVTARSGSSSCASGAPKTATTPLPETEVRVPPRPSASAISVARRAQRGSSGPRGRY